MPRSSSFFAACLLATTLFAFITFSTSIIPVSAASAFTFASIGDSHAQTANFTNTINQIKTLNPDLIIHNGDYENDGVVSSEMNAMTTVLKNASLFNNAFIVRGNHDDHVSGSAALWETYFSTSPNVKSPPAGVTNYVGMDANSTYLTYSFDYGNSRFIGVDVPGDASLLTTGQYTFLDDRLTEAESLGLTHAFIFFHGPEYCVESTHCTCTAKADSTCTPSAFITLVNKHPIVSATFHGHEHVLGHVHMDSSRVPSLTHPYEEFFTSSAGNPYSFTMYSARIDDNYSSYSLPSFALINVNDLSFTVNFYHTGNTTPVWSKTFTKSGSTRTPTFTPSNTSTTTQTLTATPIYTATHTFTPTTTFTPSNTSTVTDTPSPTSTPTLTGTATQTRTATQTFTPSSTYTPSNTFTPTYTPSSTNTPTATATRTPSPTATNTRTPSVTRTPSPTATNTRTPSVTRTPSPTATNNRTPSMTRTPSLTNTPPATVTRTFTPTATNTRTATATRTPSPTYTRTATATRTPSPTNTPTATVTRTPSSTNTPTTTATRTFTPTHTHTSTATPTQPPTHTPVPYTFYLPLVFKKYQPSQAVYPQPFPSLSGAAGKNTFFSALCGGYGYQAYRSVYNLLWNTPADTPGRTPWCLVTPK
jgi:hypothetical protein